MKVSYDAKVDYSYLVLSNAGFDKSRKMVLYISLTESKIVREMMINDT